MSARVIGAVLLAFLLTTNSACSSLTGPSPIDDRWQVHETAHFLLHVRPDSFASQHVEMFGTVLEDQYAVSLTRLESRLERRIFGFFYEPGDGGLAGGQSREGVAYPLTDAFKISTAPPLDDNVYALMCHEANHVIAEQVLGRPGTTFVNEGLASALLSERYHQLGSTFMHAWTAAARNLPPLSRLVDDAEWMQIDHATKYNASASFVAYLLDTHGAGPFKRLWGATSDQFAGRFQEAYGVTLDEAQTRWIAYVAGSIKP